MANLFVFATICTLLVATTLSFSVMNGNPEAQVVSKDQEALLALSEDGEPQFVMTGDNVGRADLSKITNIFNFTAYLQNRTPNATQLSFVPLITILSSLGRG